MELLVVEQTLVDHYCELVAQGLNVYGCVWCMRVHIHICVYVEPCKCTRMRINVHTRTQAHSLTHAFTYLHQHAVVFRHFSARVHIHTHALHSLGHRV
jgi:hypothetical protein